MVSVRLRDGAGLIIFDTATDASLNSDGFYKVFGFKGVED